MIIGDGGFYEREQEFVEMVKARQLSVREADSQTVTNSSPPSHGAS